MLTYEKIKFSLDKRPNTCYNVSKKDALCVSRNDAV